MDPIEVRRMIKFNRSQREMSEWWFEDRIKRLDKQVLRIQDRCKHPDKTWHPDDWVDECGFYTCNDCGKDLEIYRQES